jgi:hypothetical protein
MSASRILRVSVLALLLIPASSVGAQLMARATSDPEYIVVSRFRAAVETYVVRHHVFEPLSPELMCLPEDTVAAVNALAEVPREAWPAPREGEIFAPDVADLFRHRLAATFYWDEYNPGDLLGATDKEGLFAPPIRVNEPLPRRIGADAAPFFTPALPPLPEQLAYRLVGRDLVLIDVVESNLVVDVIRAALPVY